MGQKGVHLGAHPGNNSESGWDFVHRSIHLPGCLSRSVITTWYFLLAITTILFLPWNCVLDQSFIVLSKIDINIIEQTILSPYAATL